MTPRPTHFPRLTLAASLLALLLVAGLFAVDLVGARQRHLDSGIRQVEHHGRMLAEHVARSLDSVDILLAELRPQISELRPWWALPLEEGHALLHSRLGSALPQVRHLIVFDAEGRQRLTSFSATPPPINVRDRPYFIALRDGASRSRYGPYVGRNSQRHTYALAHRLDFPDGRFAGALMAAIEPAYFESFCAATRPFDEFEAALVNAEGRIIGRCGPVPGNGIVRAAGEDYRQVLADGSFAAQALERQVVRAESESHYLGSAPVPGYPDLRVVLSAPRARLLAQWREHARQSALLGGLALLALAAAGLLIHRQFQAIGRFTAEFKAHQENLESRIQEATAELEERRRDAEVMAEAKSRFLAAASHDLRQPLQALRLFSGQLGQPLDEAAQRVLRQRIVQAVEAMGEQLEDLLQLSRLDMAKVEPQWASVHIDQLFDKLAATYRPLADAFGVRLSFSRHRQQIHADPVLLVRLLGNLIHNAIKFSPHGTVLVCARWGVGDSTRIEVRDNGAGIDEKYQKAIFEEFFQLRNRAREAHAGLGLGLSIVSRIARLLDSQPELRSRTGAGSTFSLRFDAPPDTPEDAVDEVPQTRLLLIGRTGTGLRSFAQRATEWNYEIRAAVTAAEAATLLARERMIPVVFPDPKRQDADELAALLAAHPGIVIHPEGADLDRRGPYHLCLPLKPARVRALLRSLQPASPPETGPTP